MNGFTARAASARYRGGMVINFQATMTEADFKRPLLDAAEDRLVRETRGDMDLAVEGLTDSVLSRLLRRESPKAGASAKAKSLQSQKGA